VDDLSWEKKVELSELPVLVMFWRPICVHCTEMESYFTALIISASDAFYQSRKWGSPTRPGTLPASFPV
jgi:hypothetical protein